MVNLAQGAEAVKIRTKHEMMNNIYQSQSKVNLIQSFSCYKA